MPPASLALAATLLLPCGGVDYARDVKPVLKERCFACHGALKQKAGLRLDTAAFALKGGEGGPAVEPGNPDDSLLVERVTAPEGQRMPPEGAPLKPEQVAALREWVKSGAKAPAGETPEADPRSHWAFVRPAGPPVPGRAGDNPIDAFLAAEWAKRGLTPAPPADRAVLLRRVTLDLTGLPPTRAELHAFLADVSPDAYEKVVDRLLASPRYGERWGRHWLDVWRYSDWYGRRTVPDVLNSYGMIWRWRDWVVRSANADKPYDRMVVEMLAADEAAPLDAENAAATGFVVRNFFRWNYNNWMRDNVEHTAKAFLGLTFNCCQCHDHKYDPVTQQEYFQLRAVFEPLEIRHERVPGEPDPGPYPKYSYGAAYKPIASGLVRVVDEKPDAQTFMYARGDERNRVPGKPPVPPGVPASVGGPAGFKVEPVELPPHAYYPGLKDFVRREEAQKREAAVAAAESALAAAAAKVGPALAAAADRRVLGADAERAKAVAAAEDAWLDLAFRRLDVAAARSELASLTARIAADDVKYLGKPGDLNALARAAARAEKQAAHDTALAARAKAACELAAARRDAKAKASVAGLEAKAKAAPPPVPADAGAAYTPLGPIYPNKSSGRRLALAKWIASPDNPLTARVAVNHVWMRHFGRPLVETPHDFGRNGKPPTHPQLLDWLACRLVADGWRVKPLHRLIVTSAAYRMRSTHPAADANKAIDPDGVYLWKFPTNRLEAEAVRDSLLAAAGELDAAAGGPEIPQDQGLTSKRRSLYFAHHGEQRMAFLELFDAPNPNDCYRRVTSVMPQQSLALANSELPAAMARALAGRLPAADDGSFVVAAFEQVLGRPPTAAERSAAASFLARRAKAGRGRENLVHALFNHSDFVTVR